MHPKTLSPTFPTLITLASMDMIDGTFHLLANPIALDQMLLVVHQDILYVNHETGFTLGAVLDH